MQRRATRRTTAGRGVRRRVTADHPQIALPWIDLERGNVAKSGRLRARKIGDVLRKLVDDGEFARVAIADDESARDRVVGDAGRS